jgi:hypothetical protein
MLLSQRLRFGLSFNIFNSIHNVKEALLAPRKHIKAAIESTGNEYSQQTNLTA